MTDVIFVKVCFQVDENVNSYVAFAVSVNSTRRSLEMNVCVCSIHSRTVWIAWYTSLFVSCCRVSCQFCKPSLSNPSRPQVTWDGWTVSAVRTRGVWSSPPARRITACTWCAGELRIDERSVGFQTRRCQTTSLKLAEKCLRCRICMWLRFWSVSVLSVKVLSVACWCL